mgnify:CR=1 FL=1
MLRETDVELLLLTRARNREESVQRFWAAMQLHMDPATYYSYLDRVRFMPGDLTAPGLGLSAEDRTLVVEQAESVLHMAGLPLESNVLFMTVMATKMPFVGRG